MYFWSYYPIQTVENLNPRIASIDVVVDPWDWALPLAFRFGAIDGQQLNRRAWFVQLFCLKISARTRRRP